MNTDKLIERAQMEAGRRNYDGAIEYYLQALAMDPGDRGARRGAREAELKRFENAYPSGVARFFSGFGPRMGVLLSSFSRDRRRKMEALEKVLATDPRNPALGMRLGALAEEEGLAEAAAAAYEGVVLGNPEHVEALIRLGRVLHGIGKIDEALQVMEKAVTLAPRNAEVQRLRKDVAADGYARDAGFAGAKTTRDLLRDADHAHQLEKAQRVVRRAEDFEEQAREARAKAEAAPGDPAAWAALGTAEAAVRRYDASEEAFARAFSLSPDDASLRTKLGDVRIAREERRLVDLRAGAAGGDAAAAAALAEGEKRLLATLVAEFRARVSAHPTDLALRHTIAGYLEKTGDLDGAVAEYQHSIRDPRRRAESLGALGRCFLAKGMFDLAANQIEKALEEGTSVGGDRQKALLYDLATVKERQGDAARARECLARIYEVDISYLDVAQRLQRLAPAAGR